MNSDNDKFRRVIAAQGLATIAFFFFTHGAHARDRSALGCTPLTRRRRLSCGARRARRSSRGRAPGTRVVPRAGAGPRCRACTSTTLTCAGTCRADGSPRTQSRYARCSLRANASSGSPIQIRLPRSASCSASSGSARIGDECAARAVCPRSARAGAARGGRSCKADREHQQRHACTGRRNRFERALAAPRRGRMREPPASATKSSSQRPLRRASTDKAASASKTASSQAAGRRRRAASRSGRAIATKSRSSGSWAESGRPKAVPLRCRLAAEHAP